MFQLLWWDSNILNPGLLNTLIGLSTCALPWRPGVPSLFLWLHRARRRCAGRLFQRLSMAGWETRDKSARVC